MLLVIILGTIIFVKSVQKNNKTIETIGEAVENQELEEIKEDDETEEVQNDDETDTNETEESLVESQESNIQNNTVTNTVTNTVNNKNKYYIKVNNSANVITIYTTDANNNYTTPVKAMVCSTGTATPQSGTYKLNGTKHKWHALFGNVYGQYTTAIVGNILFHSVPYLTKGDASSLEYWEYDKLGTSASAGCIRLTVQDAKWIYDNIATGTSVEFYSDSNPGPLGKPTSQKISDDVERRNWDPTDPSQDNPWKNVTNKTTTQQTNGENSQKKEETNNSENESKTSNENNNIKDNNSTVNKDVINNTTNNVSANSNNTTNIVSASNKDNIVNNTTTQNNAKENNNSTTNNVVDNSKVNNSSESNT
jgi:lipoprotein-anchoring transpeptidase ErfK/SrfK